MGCRLPSPNATAIWEPVTALVPTPSKLFALSPWTPSRPADLLLSKCMTPRSNSLCLLAYRSPRDHFSRPTDQTHTFCKFCFLVGFLYHENKNPFWGKKKKKKKKKK